MDPLLLRILVPWIFFTWGGFLPFWHLVWGTRTQSRALTNKAEGVRRVHKELSRPPSRRWTTVIRKRKKNVQRKSLKEERDLRLYAVSNVWTEQFSHEKTSLLKLNSVGSLCLRRPNRECFHSRFGWASWFLKDEINICCFSVFFPLRASLGQAPTLFMSGFKTAKNRSHEATPSIPFSLSLQTRTFGIFSPSPHR